MAAHGAAPSPRERYAAATHEQASVGCEAMVVYLRPWVGQRRRLLLLESMPGAISSISGAPAEHQRSTEGRFEQAMRNMLGVEAEGSTWPTVV